MIIVGALKGAAELQGLGRIIARHSIVMVKRRKRFRIRSKPEEPVRKSGIKERTTPTEGSVLSAYINWANEYGVSPDDVQVIGVGEYDYYEICLEILRDETESEYQSRLDQHKLELKTYNHWAKVNRIEIEKELRLRQEEDLAKAAKAAEKEKKARIKRVKQLERELRKSQKELDQLNAVLV